jgi:hypothetical protein
MGPKIVLTAATIALGFLVVSEQSVVQAAVADDTATLSAAYQKEPDCRTPAGAEPGRMHRAWMSSHSTRLPPANGRDGNPTGFDIVACQPPRVR